MSGEASGSKPEGGGALNSLRNFRLQKKKFVASSFTDSESSQEPASQGPVGRILASGVLAASWTDDTSQPDNSQQAGSQPASSQPASSQPASSQPASSQQTMASSLDTSASSPVRPAGGKRLLEDRSPAASSLDQQVENGSNGTERKRIRMMSDTSDSCDGSPAKVQTVGQQEEETKLSFLRTACPGKEPRLLQETLRAHQGNVDWALETLTKEQKPKPAKHKLKAHHVMEDNSESDDDEFTGKGLVYDSDEEEEGPSDDNLTVDKKKVLKFFNEGGEQEMTGIQGCNKKKVSEILKLRPFEGWVDLVTKLQTSKGLSAEMLNSATDLLRMKSAVTKLMNKCQRITAKMEGVVERLTSGGAASLEIRQQPASLTPGLSLSGYQLIGLNWLVLMHRQAINGILADEMGLGKTIQTIAFLAWLKERGDGGPHLIIVPSSTMDNWRVELEKWAPSIQIVTYWGAQDERRHLRLQLVQDELDYDVILTTYNMVISSAEDRVLFKKMEFHYVVFDEAHMLKNMASQRYEQLMKIRCSRKLLLTGTPLQNNLVELMSLLIFVMPGMFAKRKDQLKKMFSLFPKQQDESERTVYEKDRIAHAKRIMKPFFLRRLKSDVLTDLPDKITSVERVPMSNRQQELYFQLVRTYKDRAAKLQETGEMGADSAIGMLMNLRKTANHPLLVRDQFDDHKLDVIARLLKTRDSGHKEAVETFIVEDLKTMSDFDINKTCETYRCIEHLALGNHLICDSGKFQLLDDLLPEMQDRGDRVLIFSQFTMLLDVLERYLKIRGHRFLRLDGQTPVQERQALINKFNRDGDIFIFILSTRAGGLGINLTAANTVILHDLDFNPYNDKQAEDRCHRVGQTKKVRVIRFTSEDTIEEGIHQVALEKLKLEQDVTGEVDSDDKKKKKDVARLLKTALGVELKEKQIGDVGKVYTEL